MGSTQRPDYGDCPRLTCSITVRGSISSNPYFWLCQRIGKSTLSTDCVRVLETKFVLTVINYILDSVDVEFIHWDFDRLVMRPTGPSSADYRDAFRKVNDAYRRSLEATLWQTGVYEFATRTSLTIEDGARWLSGEILNRCPSGDRLDVIGL